MDDFTKFGRFVLAVGSNKETYDLLVSWLGELSVCKNFLEFPNLSELISLVLEFYNSNDETIRDCGKKMIDHLIYSTYLISKDTITVFPLFHDMSSSMKKEDPIYSKLRNNLCRMVCLCEENIKEALLKFYISEIFAEALNGIKRYAESYVMMNDASYLAGVIMLPSIIHQFSNESKSDVSIGFDSLLSMLDLLLLGDFNDKKSFLAFLHHLNIFNRLSRVIGEEDRVSSVIEGRSDSVLEIALKAVELDMVMLMESYLQYGNLMDRFLEQLLMDFDSILGRRVSREGLILFNRMLLLIKRISKNVQSREEQIRTFLASRTDEVSLMAILFEVFNDKFCSDENLLTLERSICEADPEFRIELLQTVIPEIDSGSSLILEIARKNLVDDSFKCVLAANGNHLRRTLLIKFAGENGRGPGVLREWIILQFQGMLAMDMYFETLQKDRRVLMPTRENVKNVNFFIYFGRLLALSLMHRVQGGFMLEPIVLKMLADNKITLTDVMEFDTGLRKHLTSMARNEIYGEIVPLADFIDACLNDLIAVKIAKTKEGIDDVFGSERRRFFFSILHTYNLQVILSGEPDDILIEDWALHTDYNSCERSDLQVSWFWKIVGKFSAEQKRELLCFWTSVKYLPPGGFRNLGFRPLLHIYQTDDQNDVPTASTCGFQLNLPLYESYDILEDCLYNILPFCVGFDFL